MTAIRFPRIATTLAAFLAAGIPLGLDARARPPAPQEADSGVLLEGDYAAPIKGLICAACPRMIRTALLQVEGIHEATVDRDKKTLRITVRKRSQVKLSSIEDALREAERRMGVGVRYRVGHFVPAQVTEGE